MTAPVVEVVPVTELRPGDVVRTWAGEENETVRRIGHGRCGTLVFFASGQQIPYLPGALIRRYLAPGEVRADDLKPGDRVVIERTVLAVIPHSDGQRLVVFAASRDEPPTLICAADRMLRRAT